LGLVREYGPVLAEPYGVGEDGENTARRQGHSLGLTTVYGAHVPAAITVSAPGCTKPKYCWVCLCSPLADDGAYDLQATSERSRSAGCSLASGAAKVCVGRWA
jgi:hypothetical protein